ncbi:MAG: ABC transporter permease [Actinomycetota bacterium]|nr:ABC transporter permease [Actinomycetota bacterium]
MSALAMSMRGSFLRDARIQLSYPGGLAVALVAALFSPLLFYFLARFVGKGVEDELGRYGGSYFAFVLVGLVVTVFVTVTVTTFGRALRQAQLMGVLEALLQTPSRTGSILLGSALWPYLWALVQALALMVVGTLLMGVELRIDPLGALVAALLLLGALTAVGLLISAVVLTTKRGDAVALVVSTAAMLLGGLYYPVSVLPQPLESVAEALPIWHGTEALRLALLRGGGLDALAADLWPVAAFTVVALPASLWLVERAVYSCRRRGTLGQH